MNIDLRLLLAAAGLSLGLPHVHAHEHAEADAPQAAAGGAQATTGQNAMVFAWDKELTAAIPEEVREFEPGMHGEFDEDGATGIVYTGIPGYGLVAISQDLTTWTKIGDDPRLQANVHGIGIFEHGGKKWIALAQNDAQRLVIVDLEGTVHQELGAPHGDEFSFEPANTYYGSEKPKFAVTDATYLDGTLYVVTGYSPGDFVLTATENDGKWGWGSLAWGGRGTQEGQFTTAHGIYVHEGELFVANRDAHQVIRFSKEGEFEEILPGIPEGSRICNVAYDGEHLILCPLVPVNESQSSAPIYAYKDKAIVSTIVPGDLGIPALRHIHHCWPHYVTQADGSRELYLLIHGWNKGKFAVLKHVAGE